MSSMPLIIDSVSVHVSSVFISLLLEEEELNLK